MKTFRRLLVPIAAFALLAAACGSDDSDADSAVPAGVEGDAVVFAAASLADAFTEIGDAFTAANPDAKATFSFDASSALVQQITEGAPADVFASADAANMDKLTDAGLNGGEPVVFATNLLAIIVASDNPLGITGVADLASTDIKTVVCGAPGYYKILKRINGPGIPKNAKGEFDWTTTGLPLCPSGTKSWYGWSIPGDTTGEKDIFLCLAGGPSS